MKTNKLFKLDSPPLPCLPAGRVGGVMLCIGQSLVEYAVILACFIIAVTVMGIYFKRGVSGSLRNSADMLGRQYDPRAISSSITTTVKGVSYSTTVSVVSADKRYSDTYTVTGPNEEDILSKEGDVIIAADTTRAPEVTTTTGSETITQDRDGKLW